MTTVAMSPNTNTAANSLCGGQSSPTGHLAIFDHPSEITEIPVALGGIGLFSYWIGAFRTVPTNPYLWHFIQPKTTVNTSVDFWNNNPGSSVRCARAAYQLTNTNTNYGQLTSIGYVDKCKKACLNQQKHLSSLYFFSATLF
jgi:hypothetical protein